MFCAETLVSTMLVNDSATQRIQGDLDKWFTAVSIPLGNVTQV